MTYIPLKCSNKTIYWGAFIKVKAMLLMSTRVQSNFSLPKLFMQQVCTIYQTLYRVSQKPQKTIENDLLLEITVIINSSVNHFYARQKN